jgi:hypothetical protein
MCGAHAHVRFGSKADIRAACPLCPQYWKNHLEFGRGQPLPAANPFCSSRLEKSRRPAACRLLTRPRSRHRTGLRPHSPKFGNISTRGRRFSAYAAWKVRICSSETIAEFKKRRVGGLLGGNSLSIWRDWTGWLGRQDSNLGMAESKSAALPLGYAPTSAGEPRPTILTRGAPDHSGADPPNQRPLLLYIKRGLTGLRPRLD